MKGDCTQCPKCRSPWKSVNKKGYTCRKCSTKYTVMGEIIAEPVPKPKGQVAGRIVIPGYVYRNARSNRGGE